jgi:hypothetical protein
VGGGRDAGGVLGGAAAPNQSKLGSVSGRNPDWFARRRTTAGARAEADSLSLGDAVCAVKCRKRHADDYSDGGSARSASASSKRASASSRRSPNSSRSWATR